MSNQPFRSGMRSSEFELMMLISSYFAPPFPSRRGKVWSAPGLLLHPDQAADFSSGSDPDLLLQSINEALQSGSVPI